MFCPKCGSEVQEGSAFCGKCGAPVGGAQQGAPSSAGAQAGGAPAPKKNTAMIGIAVAAVVAVVLMAGFATNWFGLAGVQPKEAVDVPAAAQEAEPSKGGDDDAQQDITTGVKSSVEAYTWNELSQISSEIAAAGSEDAAIEVAKRYNLCTPDGKLDGTQVKSVTLADGTQTAVQIAGFAHDDKTSGGKAGITFIFCNCVTEACMNDNDSNAGGWEASSMRTSLNGEYLGLLPSELASTIVAVNKLTNNTGQSDSVPSVTVTSDKLWLVSSVELFGPVATTSSVDSQQIANGAEPKKGKSASSTRGLNSPTLSRTMLVTPEDSDANYAAILDSEGFQYKLYRDMAVVRNGSNPILVKHSNNSPRSWWERTPDPDVEDSFDYVSDYGESGDYGGYASQFRGVVPAFCV